MNYRRVIKSSSSRIFTLVRFIFTVILSFVCAGLLVKMYMDSDPVTIQYLSINDCSNDEILNTSFVIMNTYYENMRAKHITTVVLLALVFVVDILLYLLNSWSRYVRKRNKKMA